jgi:hypothetical protein
MANNRELVKRLEAIEKTLNAGAVELCFVWTRSLATRIGQALAKRGDTRRNPARVHAPGR